MFKEEERGYSLLSVLLISVVFMILIISFMGQAFNSVKQNQLVEKNSKSVTLAEMGITYYQASVQNIYGANISTISDQVIQQITNDRKIGNLKSSDYYVKLGVSSMKQAIQSGLEKEKKLITIDDKPNLSFSINDIDYYRTTQDNKILLKVIGNGDGKTTILSTEMTFSPTISGLTNSGGSGYIPPNFNSIPQPKPEDNHYCSDPNSIGSCKSILVTITPKTFNDKLNNTDALTIYSKGELTLDPGSNANNMSNVHIHTDKNLTIGGNVQNASNILFEVMGNLNITGQFKLLSGSRVYVMGNVTLTKNLTLESGSIMCVNGSLDTHKVHNIGGDLVVKSDVTESVWTTKCGTPPNTTVVWGDKVYNSVNYGY
jgi:hypothetical protein